MEHEAPQTLAAPSGKQADLSLFAKLGPILGLLGIIGYWVAFGFNSGHAEVQSYMAKAYMYGWTFWMAMTLGCLGMTLLHHTVRGSWGLAILRIFEAGSSVGALVTMFVAYIPMMLFQDKVYPWTDMATTDPVLIQKHPFYNPVVFDIRQVILFAIWIFLAWKLRSSSLRQDSSHVAKESQDRTNLAAPGMVIFTLTATLASTDWVMSMDPHWYSTMFGPILIISGCLGAMALAVILALANRDKEPFNKILTPDVTKDFGNMLLTLTMLWAYFNFSQFVIIWNGNLPATAEYYVQRSSPYGFNIIGGLLILLCFAIPFVCLLSPKVKRVPGMLLQVAMLIFAMRLFDIYYIVAPVYSRSMLPGVELASFVAVGGLWLWAFGASVKSAGLYPTHDMRLMEAQQHGS